MTATIQHFHSLALVATAESISNARLRVADQFSRDSIILKSTTLAEQLLITT